LRGSIKFLGSRLKFRVGQVSGNTTFFLYGLILFAYSNPAFFINMGVHVYAISDLSQEIFLSLTFSLTSQNFLAKKIKLVYKTFTKKNVFCRKKLCKPIQEEKSTLDKCTLYFQYIDPIPVVKHGISWRET
jgi:hypothetical protein